MTCNPLSFYTAHFLDFLSLVWWQARLIWRGCFFHPSKMARSTYRDQHFTTTHSFLSSSSRVPHSFIFLSTDLLKGCDRVAGRAWTILFGHPTYTTYVGKYHCRTPIVEKLDLLPKHLITIAAQVFRLDHHSHPVMSTVLRCPTVVLDDMIRSKEVILYVYYTPATFPQLEYYDYRYAPSSAESPQSPVIGLCKPHPRKEIILRCYKLNKGTPTAMHARHIGAGTKIATQYD